MAQMGATFMEVIMGLMYIMGIKQNLPRVQSITKVMVDRLGTRLEMHQTRGEVFQGDTEKRKPCQQVVGV